MKRFLVLMIGLTLLMLAWGCRPSSTPIPAETELVGRITFAGSTTLQPLAHELGVVFKVLHPGVVLDIAAGGSVVGIQAVHEGTVDIGMASRDLKPEEAEGLGQYQVAADVIAVVVHDTNSVENLTLSQLKGIYLGEITNWQQVGGGDLPIVAVVRAKSSGTRGAFDKIVLEKQAPAAPEMQEAVTAGDMAVAVANDTAAIGYVGFGHLAPGLKLLAIDGVLPSEETAQDGSYRLVRPLLFLTGPLTQPLAQEFISFAQSPEGQQIVEDSGWVPVK